MLINLHILFKKSLGLYKHAGTNVFSMVSPDIKLFHGRNLAQQFLMRRSAHYFSGLRPYLVRSRIYLFVPKSNVVIYRCIRTSEPRKTPLWFLVNPILKVTALITGRTFRKWWKDLPPNKKKYFIDQVKANKKSIGIWLSTSVLLSFGYYIAHLEEAPITKRKRFMIFTPKQMEEINKYELEHIMQTLGPQILPENHPYTKRVRGLVQRIVDANSEIEEVKNKKFGVAVIDNSIENAFVLPIGHVFVFTGMMKLCSNDDQLGTILAHEIAHCILNHGAEKVSFSQVLDLISIVIITIIWALFPSDSISLLTQWLYSKSIQVLLELPFSRKTEVEADEIGLLLAAKACFDVRESSAFWSKMAFFKRTIEDSPDIEFLSSHPSHERRSEYLDNIMDGAIKLRSDCGCPRLSYTDPRQDVEKVSKVLEVARKRFYEQNTKPVIILK